MCSHPLRNRQGKACGVSRHSVEWIPESGRSDPRIYSSEGISSSEGLAGTEDLAGAEDIAGTEDIAGAVENRSG